MYAFLFTIIGILIAGVILFILTGFIHVKKNCVAIVERLGLYVGTYTKRWIYFTPLMYRRVGYYYLGTNKREIKINDERKIRLSYQITNVLLYHYKGHDITNTILRAKSENDNILNITVLKDALVSIGLKFIDVEEILQDK